MADVTRDQIIKAASTPRWAALTTLDVASADLNRYDRGLIREPRLLVPVDVQAFVVPAGAGGDETMVRLPFRDSDDALDPLDVRDPGAVRPSGVHLLWSVPTALGNGRIVDDPAAPGDATRRRLDLPLLPDRWVVLRLAVAGGAREPMVTGWVVDAVAATVTPLADYPTVSANSRTVGTPVPREQLTMHVGGPAWAQCYDAAQGRLSLHDPLDDLAGVELEGDALSYVVAGWWTRSEDDPLDGVGSDVGYRARLDELGWNDPDHPSPDTSRRDDADRRHRIAKLFGMTPVSRYTQDYATRSGKAPATTRYNTGYVTAEAMELRSAVSGFAEEVISAVLLPSAPTRTTLLHGRIHGIPLRRSPSPDSRPPAAGLRTAIGASTSDVAATMAVTGSALNTSDDEARRGAERLLAAFSAGLMSRLRQSDTWSDIDAYEHTRGFGTLPGGTEGVDRFVDKPAAPRDPGSGFRPGKKVGPKVRPDLVADATILWSAKERPYTKTTTSFSAESRRESARDTDVRSGTAAATSGAKVREVVRPAPRFHQPGAPVLAVVGGGRTMTAIEREEATGELVCRLSDQVDPGHTGLLTGAQLLRTLGTAAVPDEVLLLARESLAEDPNLTGWRARLADRGGSRNDLFESRFRAEAALSFAYYAADDDRLAGITGTPVESAASRQRATEALTRFSMSAGVWSHPEGVTQWGQPWRPLFCDWEVTLELGPLTGWTLGGIDLEPGVDPVSPVTLPDTVVVQGRSAVLTGAAGTIAAGVERWLTEERARDLGGHGLAEPATETALAALRDVLSRLDLMSVALDGIREQLLGLRYDRGLVMRDVDALPDGTRRALAVVLPRLLSAGRLTLTWARLVDAFGRLLDLPLDPVVSARVADTSPRAMVLRPRLAAPARWRLDLVDATSTALDAQLAKVDQSDAAAQATPIAGFLLPDHMDESLEVFSADGRPLGELLHDPFSDAVSWEIAPGRTDVAPGAGPTEDPDTRNHRVGWIAAGLVAADATSRQGTPDRPETESPLSALLRAIDTTLWTVDPFGSLGREHIAGLVGRPIAVVAARLALDVLPDTEALVYDPEALRTGRTGAYADLAQLALEVRLGELTRSDDGLLGYFVDDDYSHFHLVDKVIAAQALPSGRCQGVLATEGAAPNLPVPIEHSYVDASGVLRIHPGQTVRLTLLMHPGGKVHLTSGILPRTSRALSRDWVAPGLSVLAPSLRVGPLLIDADKVRLPKVAAFPAEQLFTRRDTPTTWKDDPILAATQSALLPDTAPEVQEGWIRVAPNPPAEGQS
ncbi:MAG: hypothetical protein ABIM89_09115 [Mycobacteriales bacterium]